MNPAIVGLTINYLDVRRTTRCAHSLLDDGAIHVLIWDNSADNGDNARTMQDFWKNEPRVTVICTNRNLGFAAGINQGMEWIQIHYPGAWIFLVNNDAVALPGCLQELHRTLSNNKESFLTYPEITDGNISQGTIYYQRWFALVTSKALPGSFPYPSGCALLVAPERLKHPLFDSDFFMYGEDVLLGWLHRKSRHLAVTPTILVWHEGSASSQVSSPFYETRLVASHFMLARKLANSKIEYILMIFGRLLSLPTRAAIRAVRFSSSEPLKALWTGWKERNGGSSAESVGS